jgi:hypothetical protein
MGCCALGLWRLARRPGQGRFSETSDWGSARIRVRAGWKTGTFRFVNLLGMGKRFLSLTCTQPDGSESHPCPGRFSETADWDLGSVRWNTRTFRFVNLLGMGRRLLSLTCIQPDSSERAIPARAGMFFRNVRAGFQSAITIIPLPVAYP